MEHSVARYYSTEEVAIYRRVVDLKTQEQAEYSYLTQLWNLHTVQQKWKLIR